jgi:PAS domain S-box-containing protein
LYGQKLLAASAAGQSFHAECRVRRQDGEWRWVDSWAVPRSTESDNPPKMIGCSADITERKRAEEALRESEEKFKEFAENVDQVFWMTDPKNLQMIYLSPAFERIWGRSCESLYSSPSSWVEAIHPEDRHRVLQAVDVKAKTGVDYELEYRIARPDGEMRWISDRSFPIRSTAGNIYRVGGIARDITLRKQIEEELAAHRAQLEEAQSLPQLGRWNWDIPTNTLPWSDELYRIFGLRREEISAAHTAFLEFLHPKDRASFEAVHQGALNGDRLYDFEATDRRGKKHKRNRVFVKPERQDCRSASSAVDGAARHPRCGRIGALRNARWAGAHRKEA